MTAFAAFSDDLPTDTLTLLRSLPLATGSATDLSMIRKVRRQSAKHTPADLDWTPRPSYREDRDDFHHHYPQIERVFE